MRRHWFPLVLILLPAISAFAQMQQLGPQETLATSKLSASEIKQIEAEVEASAYDTPASWAAELRARRVDLGAARGLIVQGTNLLCGGTGNCQTWVLRSAGGKWISMFASSGKNNCSEPPLAEGFELGPARAHGIKDFTVSANSSARSGSRVTYKFDGNCYRPLQQ